MKKSGVVLMLSNGGALHASNYEKKRGAPDCPLLRLRLGAGKLIAHLSFMISLRLRHESMRLLCAGAAAKSLRFGMAWRWRKFALQDGIFAFHKDKAFMICATFLLSQDQ